MAWALTNNQKNWSVFLGTIGLSTLVYVAYLGSIGTSEENVFSVLRWSARLSFLALTLVFVARPLQQLVKKPWTAKLLRRRRLIGIAFAGLHTAHLGFIIYRGRISDEYVFRAADNLAGTVGYVVILLMLITSWDSTARMLGRRNWKVLHTIGLFGLFAAFTNFVRPASLETATPISWLLLAIALGALTIRVLANLKQRQQTQ